MKTTTRAVGMIAWAGLGLAGIASGATIVLEYGVDGYTNAYDTFVWAQQPAADYSAASTLSADASLSAPGVAGTGESRPLFLFDIDGVLPARSAVTSATLSLYFLEVPRRDDLKLLEMDELWNDTSTWNSLTDPVGGSLAPVDAQRVELGRREERYHAFDVTTSIAAWQSGASANRGWVLANPSRDEARMQSMEAPAGQRPRLTIDYSAVPEPVTAVLLLLGGLAFTGPWVR
jgi:hypothetical protein